MSSGMIVVYFFWVVPLYGHIISVDDDGGADYTNVIEALQAASDGDTILVAEGSYYGPIAITKSIALLGAGPGLSTISSVDDVITIDADGAKVRGFTIDVGAMMLKAVNIHVLSCSPEITYNTFTFFSEGKPIYAIECYGPSAPEIHYNNFSGKWIAIALVYDSLDVNAENNWWGTTDESRIQLMIEDGNDNPGLGIVDYAPYLSRATDVEYDKTHSIVRDFCFYQNYPNPFNPETTIEFALPKETQVRLSVYNLLGQRVRSLVDEHREAGQHRVIWDSRDEFGTQVPAGIYVCHMVAGELVQSIKMALVR